MSAKKTINERIASIGLSDGTFNETMKGDPNYGKLASLAGLLISACEGLAQNLEMAAIHPHRILASSDTVARQSIVIQELLAPIEDMALGHIKPSGWIAAYKEAVEKDILSGYGVSMNSTSASLNQTSYLTYKVRCEILKMLR